MSVLWVVLSYLLYLQYADTVLATFKSLKLDDSKVHKQKQKLKAIRNLKDKQTFFAKYLTSDKVSW